MESSYKRGFSHKTDSVGFGKEAPPIQNAHNWMKKQTQEKSFLHLLKYQDFADEISKNINAVFELIDEYGDLKKFFENMLVLRLSLAEHTKKFNHPLFEAEQENQKVIEETLNDLNIEKLSNFDILAEITDQFWLCTHNIRSTLDLEDYRKSLNQEYPFFSRFLQSENYIHILMTYLKLLHILFIFDINADILKASLPKFQGKIEQIIDNKANRIGKEVSDPRKDIINYFKNFLNPNLISMADKYGLSVSYEKYQTEAKIRKELPKEKRKVFPILPELSIENFSKIYEMEFDGVSYQTVARSKAIFGLMFKNKLANLPSLIKKFLNDFKDFLPKKEFVDTIDYDSAFLKTAIDIFIKQNSDVILSEIYSDLINNTNTYLNTSLFLEFLLDKILESYPEIIVENGILNMDNVEIKPFILNIFKPKLLEILKPYSNSLSDDNILTLQRFPIGYLQNLLDIEITNNPFKVRGGNDTEQIIRLDLGKTNSQIKKFVELVKPLSSITFESILQVYSAALNDKKIGNSLDLKIIISGNRITYISFKINDTRRVYIDPDMNLTINNHKLS